MTNEAAAKAADDAVIRLFSPPQVDDPYPLYDAVRDVNRVFRSPSIGIWAVTGYAESSQVLRIPDTRNGPRAASTLRPDWADHESLRMYMSALITMDPPDHTRVRGLAGRVFTPAAVRAIGPAIEKLMQRFLGELAEKAADGGSIDLIRDLASPFPVAVISEMLGVPDVDGVNFYDLANDWSRVWAGGYYTEHDLTRANAAATELRGYFDELIQDRTRQPREDLLSVLTREAQDAKLSPDELMALATFLFVAGFETTTSLIANGVLALMDHPDQLELWRTDPSVTGSAVEELLRHSTPIAAASRMTTDVVALGDQQIPKGNLIVALLGAANRDPAQFPDPARLDLKRKQGAHLSFSAGPHFCMGGNLARLEAQILFPEFIKRFDTMEMAGATRRRDAIGLNGYEELPLKLTLA